MKKEIRELNAPAIDLIADILDKHMNAILSEVIIRFKQIKTDQSSEGRAAPQGLCALPDLFRQHCAQSKN